LHHMREVNLQLRVQICPILCCKKIAEPFVCQIQQIWLISQPKLFDAKFGVTFEVVKPA